MEINDKVIISNSLIADLGKMCLYCKEKEYPIMDVKDLWDIDTYDDVNFTNNRY